MSVRSYRNDVIQRGLSLFVTQGIGVRRGLVKAKTWMTSFVTYLSSESLRTKPALEVKQPRVSLHVRDVSTFVAQSRLTNVTLQSQTLASYRRAASVHYHSAVIAHLPNAAIAAHRHFTHQIFWQVMMAECKGSFGSSSLEWFGICVDGESNGMFVEFGVCRNFFFDGFEAVFEAEHVVLEGGWEGLEEGVDLGGNDLRLSCVTCSVFDQMAPGLEGHVAYLTPVG